ncbi:MAG: hypothetical protein HZB51_10635 [Chloroflexi bacterium]|nr:hypothetical protein [Chloroflexota bacterium]
MPNLESLTYPLLVVLAVIIIGWFALGTQFNVRKGDRVLKWLHEGMPLIGEKTTMHWMGSSVLQLKIAKGKAPYRSSENLFVFEPRDVLFLWALSRMQGRRDLIIFRGTLNASPSFELEIFDPKGWTTQSTKRHVETKNWSLAELSSQPDLRAYYSGNGGAQAVASLTALAIRSGARLMRLSIHRDVPNVEAHWYMPNLDQVSARDLYSSLREIGDQAIRG